ncbi:hypothetical protein NL676_007414 [Syzygium grande]|nr:hypothetical protein NL676_007414 [Syzygium grande]
MAISIAPRRIQANRWKKLEITNRKTTDSELRGGGNHRRGENNARRGRGILLPSIVGSAAESIGFGAGKNPRRVRRLPETARSSAGFGIGPTNLRR